MRHEEREKLVDDFFPGQLNARKEKERFFGYQTVGYGEDGPDLEEHTTGVSEWSHTEKRSQLAEQMVLGRQEYLVQLPTGVSSRCVQTAAARATGLNHSRSSSPTEALSRLPLTTPAACVRTHSVTALGSAP